MRAQEEGEVRKHVTYADFTDAWGDAVRIHQLSDKEVSDQDKIRAPCIEIVFTNNASDSEKPCLWLSLEEVDEFIAAIIQVKAQVLLDNLAEKGL